MLYIFDDSINNNVNTQIFKEYITNFSSEILAYKDENLNYIKESF
ncbi:MAG: hypothetical protein ACK5G7_03465 [Erysipelotrichaceae bacterium]